MEELAERWWVRRRRMKTKLVGMADTGTEWAY